MSAPSIMAEQEYDNIDQSWSDSLASWQHGAGRMMRGVMSWVSSVSSVTGQEEQLEVLPADMEEDRESEMEEGKKISSSSDQKQRKFASRQLLVHQQQDEDYDGDQEEAEDELQQGELQADQHGSEVNLLEVSQDIKMLVLGNKIMLRKTTQLHPFKISNNSLMCHHLRQPMRLS